MVVSLLLAALLSSDAPPITWDAPAACPRAEHVAAKLEAITGRPSSDLGLAVAATVVEREKRSGARWELQLELHTAHGTHTRTLRADACAAFADSIAVLAAGFATPSVTPSATPSVTNDPEPTDAPRPADEATTPRPKPTQAKARPPATSSATPALRRRMDPATGRFGVWTRVRGGGEYGAVPRGTGGFELALAFGGRRLRGEITGAYWIGRSVARHGTRLRVHLGVVAPRICGTLPIGRLDLVTCGGAEVGVLRADILGAPRRTATPLWVAALGELGLRWPVGRRVSLWASAIASVPLTYGEFELDNPREPSRPASIYRPERVGVRALFGVELRVFGANERSR